MHSAPSQIIPGSSSDTSYGFRKCCEAVREAVPLEEVARRYTKLKPLGGRAWFTGRCPLPNHADKDPSFYIYPPGRYHCYGCGGHGDCIDLEFHCGDYGELWEALIALAVEYNVELPRRPESWYRKQERQRPIRDAIEEARKASHRRRLFRCLVLPGSAAEGVEDAEERRQEVRRTWEDFECSMKALGL